MKYIKLFENFQLFEKIADVNEDVDFLYNTYFKDGIDYIQKTDTIDKTLFKKGVISSSELVSPLSIKAHNVSPIEIYINDENIKPYTNHYSPYKNIINLCLNSNAVMHLMDYKTIQDAANHLDNIQKKQFLKEFDESRIKGTIHHELAHWIDDALHNSNIKMKLSNRKEKGVDITSKNINFTDMELHAQIHNIVQLKRKYGDIWNNITFEEMIELSPILMDIKYSTRTDYEDKQKWVFRLKKRMAREGLLGKRMYN
jgi:hypothetical protein